MKTPLITLLILGFLSTPTVATFIVGTWTHYKEKQMDEIIAHGTFIRTAVPGQDKKENFKLDDLCNLKAQDTGKKQSIAWDQPDQHKLRWFDQPIPGCPSDLRIQMTDKNMYGRLVDPAQPDQDFGMCYKVPSMGDGMIRKTCEGGDGKEVFYNALLICLANKCGGSYERYMPVPGKPVLYTSAAIAPRATAAFHA